MKDNSLIFCVLCTKGPNYNILLVCQLDILWVKLYNLILKNLMKNQARYNETELVLTGSKHTCLGSDTNVRGIRKGN